MGIQQFPFHNSSRDPFQKYNLKSELRDNRNLKLKVTLTFLGIVYSFLAIHLLRKLRHGAITCPTCRVGMKNKGPDFLLEVPGLARAPVGEGRVAPTIS